MTNRSRYYNGMNGANWFTDAAKQVSDANKLANSSTTNQGNPIVETAIAPYKDNAMKVARQLATLIKFGFTLAMISVGISGAILLVNICTLISVRNRRR